MVALQAVAVLLLSTIAYCKITFQTPLSLESLGRNVVLGDISYFIPGWPEVRDHRSALSTTD